MSFVNSNYQAKLSPTMTENWLVQIFKNNNSSIATTDTPDLRFSFSETTYNNLQYYPAILNKPSISYSLDLKGFTTKTGNVTLNLANIDLDGTTLLGLLGNEYINGHVNIISQIDNDNTANNALQLFSGKISSFGYRGNTIVINLISFRPFQNVSLPTLRTSNPTETQSQYNNKLIPLIYGDFQASSGIFNGDVFACPFLKNDGEYFYYIVPSNATDSSQLEYYDKTLKRFLTLIDTKFTLLNETLNSFDTYIDVDEGLGTFKVGDRVQVDDEQMDISLIVLNTLTVTRGVNGTTATTHADNTPIYLIKDNTTVLSVPKNMKRQADVTPDEIPSGLVVYEQNASITSGDLTKAVNGNTSDSVTIADSTGWTDDIGGFKLKLNMPQISGKITGLKMTINGDVTQSHDALVTADGLRIIVQNSESSPTADDFVLGSTSAGNKNTSIDLTSSCTDIDVYPLITEGTSDTMPAEIWLHFKFSADSSVIANYVSYSVVIENITFEITIENDLTNEPVASTTFNAGVEVVYLGRDVLTPGFTEHTTATTIGDLNNPVAIHRQLLDDINIADFTGDTEIENSGFKSVAELRDSTLTSPTSTHWKTRLQIQEKESLEDIMGKLQYEGCFFFEFSPQAQQTAISGVTPLRYFTIEDSVTAAADLSQNDISDYELGITPAQDLETHLIVNYKPHPAENQYLKQDEFTASTHTTIFANTEHQKQEINLDYLYDAVDDVVGSRNSSWINFRKSLFGEYKTTVSATLVNPEKYGMLQVGDFIDFGEITFSELGSPFNEISDTFDSYVAMPTRLFSAAWSGKKFIITNLKRTIGKITIQTQEV